MLKDSLSKNMPKQEYITLWQMSQAKSHVFPEYFTFG